MAQEKFPRPEVGWLHLAMAGVFLTGIGLIAAPHYFPVGQVVDEILRDLGIAACISVLIAGLIELSLARKTFVKGLDAIMMRTVPEDVWRNFRDHIISERLIREHYVATLTVVEQGTQYKLTTSLKYELVSLRSVLNTTITHELDHHRPPATPPGKVTKATITSGSDVTTGTTEENKIVLPVKLKGYGSRSTAEVGFEELINDSDTVVLWMSYTTRKVTVKTDLPDSWTVEVRTAHSAQDQIEEGHPWKFTGVMFAGQGVEIRLKSG